MLKLRTLLLSDKLYVIATLLITILALLFCNYYKYKSHYLGNEKNIIGYINNIKIDGNKISIELKAKEKINVIYYTKDEKELTKIKKNYKLGDYLNVIGELKKTKNNTLFNLFNNKKYLYYKKIFYLLNASDLIKIKNNNKISYKLKQFIIDKIDNIKYSKNSIKAFAFSDSYYIDERISDTYKTNGISHLLALSGSHISILSIIILYILKKLNFSEFKRYCIVILILVCYSFLANFSPSIIRATLFFFLLTINKLYYFNIKSINILFLTFIILIIINPYYLYDLGFQFSFVICFYLIIFKEYISSTNEFITLFKVSFISFLSSMPITIYNFYQINLLSVIYNLFFVPLVSFIIYPLSLLTILFPFLDNMLSKFILIMENASLLVDKINFSKIILCKPTIIIIIIYYVIITLTIFYITKKNYKFLIILCLFIFIHHNINYINPYPTITMIDVGQGDCFLISLDHNKGNILIDTGGKMTYYNEKYKIKNKNYSIAKDTIIPYLKSIGVTHLDYLIITHGDDDHIGEALNLINNFKINKIIMNGYGTTDLEKEIIKNNKVNFKYSDDVFMLNNLKLYILNPINDLNENDNSLVIYFKINNYKFLFTGDISTKSEQQIIKKYKLPKIDFLKVSHHGSKTSTSIELLDAIKPKYGLISVGINNKFGHPSQGIINRLKNYNVKLFLTSEIGSLKIILKNKIEFVTCN